MLQHFRTILERPVFPKPQYSSPWDFPICCILPSTITSLVFASLYDFPLIYVDFLSFPLLFSSESALVPMASQLTCFSLDIFCVFCSSNSSHCPHHWCTQWLCAVSYRPTTDFKNLVNFLWCSFCSRCFDFLSFPSIL